MRIFLTRVNHLFDRTHHYWESHYSKTMAAILLLVVYLTELVLIELGRRSLLPPALTQLMPRSHNAAISMAFTVLLYIEVIDLVFGLAASVSRSVGKQFEIFSLILLRQSFKDFSELPEPLEWPASPDIVFHILSSAGGALLIFTILVVYYRMLQQRPITSDESETLNFISAKKAISLLLLALFVLLGIYHVVGLFRPGATHDFFATFYTILVFCDILIVLVSMRYSNVYPIVFRNSGFALATVVLRLGLAAPAYYNALLGVGAAFYVLGLIAVYNAYGQSKQLDSSA
jgi:hypothetical protein